MHNGYNNMKRQRGRGRKPGGGGGGGHHHQNHPNRAMESSGPEIKVRGTASHIYERYLQLSRDAASAGDRVLSENYAQYADHYFRVVRAMQPAMPPPQPQAFNDSEFDADEEAPQGARSENAQPAGDENSDQPDVDFPSGEQQQPQFNRDREGDPRRRRGRRNRYRSEGEGGEGAEFRDGGEERREERASGPRNERQERGERREREAGSSDDQGGPEGFSNSPKPAFLRD
jgi:Domain of unknown function (DUF4167)